MIRRASSLVSSLAAARRHHPAIYDVEPAELEAIQSSLRKMRAKEQTLSRQKRREDWGQKTKEAKW